MINRIKAQSTLEYAMVIVCVASALIAMQIYVKRSIQGRLRNAADEVGEQYSAKTTTSYTEQIFISKSTVTGDPLIVDVRSETGGGTEPREFIATRRTEHQDIIQKKGNYEETGKFEEQLFD